MLLSLFCGAGGLDVGFEQAKFEIGLAFDRNPNSVASYNLNRPEPSLAHIRNVARLSPEKLDKLFGKRFSPIGVIGGPPCQSFSQANVNQRDDDPRQAMPKVHARLVAKLHARSALDFFVLENVVGLTLAKHKATLEETIRIFDEAGFEVTRAILDAQHHGVPQTRRRLFLVGFNRRKFGALKWIPPKPSPDSTPTVRSAIHGLPKPLYFKRDIEPAKFDFHPNHWCMQPKSKKFTTRGALTEGDVKSRSFKTLAWDKPSIAVAYGHREVHIHPDGKRRLSVYEAMRLQTFPDDYELVGSLSSQITQVSEAVPPKLAKAVALSIKAQLGEHAKSGRRSPVRRAEAAARVE